MPTGGCRVRPPLLRDAGLVTVVMEGAKYASRYRLRRDPIADASALLDAYLPEGQP